MSPFVDTRATGLLPSIRSISAMIAGVNFETTYSKNK